MSSMALTARQFHRSLIDFADMSKRREHALFVRVDIHIGRSIRYGSATTGAPGQPVRKGNLLKSYKRIGSVEAREIAHVSNSPYAHVIEHNKRGAVLRSPVGGFHSVKLTRLHWKLIVRQELNDIKRKIRIRHA